jgi:fatty acid desaturase
MIAGLLGIIFRKPLSKAMLESRGVKRNDKVDKINEMIVFLVGLGWIVLPLLVLLGIIKSK